MIFMLPGIKIIDLKKNPDERGSFTEIMREDWKDLLGEDKPVQSNFSITFPDIVKAWHRHVRGQVDYYVVLKGTIKVCAFDEMTGELTEHVLSGDKMQIMRVPGHYWHGLKTIGEPSMMIYFVTKLYDYQSPDEGRKPWDDKTVVPKTINGKATDPRVGKPWDWFASPHK